MKLVFLDTETTSLRHDRRAWEIAWILRNDEGKEAERQYFINETELDLGNADPKSLQIGRFYERHPAAVLRDQDPFEYPSAGGRPEYNVLWELEHDTRGALIVGAVPNFDTEVIGNRMREHGICPSWHYHLVDVETLAAGALKLLPPWNFDKVLDAYGLTYDEADRHTALGDARMARDLYDAVMTHRNADVAARLIAAVTP